MIPRNVVLTGFMGTGKTTVGRMLAAELGYAYVDTDEVIEARFGPITEIFARGGESEFRQLERLIARELASSAMFVIATGGRMMLDPVNEAALGSTARVFCLVASAAEILRRLGEETRERPLLDVPDRLSRVEELLAEREAGYARFEQVETDGFTAEEIVADLMGRLGLEPR
ncbi:MAG: shikimate kinase [Acidimicrobiia bacterium]|nr:shikimate kinase [Acidimicrobiia bacterium]